MTTTGNYGYADPTKVTAVRVFFAEKEGWYIDGIDNEGRYTEAWRVYHTYEEALADVRDFRGAHGIPESAVVI